MRFCTARRLCIILFIFIGKFAYGQDSAGNIYHIVKQGETFHGISNTYDIPLDSLIKWNDLSDGKIIEKGQRLIVKKASSPDTLAKTLINASRQGILPIYHESGKIKHKHSLRDTILNYYKKSNIFYRLIIYVNVFFILSSIILSFIVVARRLYKLSIRLRGNKIRERYRNILIEWIYEEQRESVTTSLKMDFRNKINRDIFTTELLFLHSVITGDSAKKLVDLYLLSGLKRYSIKKAKSWLWNVRAKGFRELAQMDITEASDLIYKHMSSRNSLLRLEAQLAWIKLNSENPDIFNNFPNVQISQWGQINLLDILEKNGTTPDFGQLLNSSNKEIVIFALKMIAFFNQFHNTELVSSLLDNENGEIRREVICTLGKMEVSGSAEKLKALFPEEEILNKIEIVRALNSINDFVNIPFLKSVLLNETNINLRILAARGLITGSTECSAVLDSILADADPLLIKVINHAKCEVS